MPTIDDLRRQIGELEQRLAEVEGKSARSAMAQSKSAKGHERKDLMDEIADLNARLDDLDEAVSDGDIDPDDARREIEAINEAHEALDLDGVDDDAVEFVMADGMSHRIAGIQREIQSLRRKSARSTEPQPPSTSAHLLYA